VHGERRPRQGEMGNRHLFLFHEEARSRLYIGFLRSIGRSKESIFVLSGYFFSRMLYGKLSISVNYLKSISKGLAKITFQIATFSHYVK
jgi:hypothetical protein